MLIIPKVKLYLARGLFWGGLLGAIAVAVTSADIGVFLIVIAAGFVGAWLLDKLYTCPSCGYKLLKGNGMNLSFHEKCPDKCPGCKTPITVEIK